MANQTTISDLEEALADVCAREELLERELEDARSAKEAFRYVLAVLNRTRNPTAKPIGIHRPYSPPAKSVTTRIRLKLGRKSHD